MSTPLFVGKPSRFKEYMKWVNQQLKMLCINSDVLVGDLTPDEIDAISYRKFEAIHG